jgi:hypothetical protein
MGTVVIQMKKLRNKNKQNYGHSHMSKLEHNLRWYIQAGIGM